ncbi:terminase small subunit [Bdellovibrio sp. SKB1291214]|uniref:terminase small subunit n=1 Tax=Bdellovibrio sp. SKB1291214 TaxID=1732569 RepID=UPI000B516D3A|nr:terminase small subunit [Bdellovibrio sp. SKB1291214]UYL10283.1 terminase small subunit [Bdellovibrio sp. SKB1291214]
MCHLSSKQERFCLEYMVDLNAKKAAIRAGYSPHTAMEQGYQLLQKTSVQSKLTMLMEERASRLEVNADLVVDGLKNIAFRDIRDLFGKNGELLPIASLPRGLATSISAIEIIEGPGLGQRTYKINFYSKIRALELLGKHVGFFKKESPVGQPSLAKLIGQINKPEIKDL